MKHEYKIIGKCPFGNCVVDENGQMDETQFCTNDPAAYIDMTTGGRLAIMVARQYGAEPVCEIVTDFCTIRVYNILNMFGAEYEYDGGMHSIGDVVWRNTVNPAAIVRNAWDGRPLFAKIEAEPIQQNADPAEIPDVKTFGPKLKECRLAAGLSQKQLAEKIGRTQVDVNRWEGGRCPNALILKRLALALGCSMDDLV